MQPVYTLAALMVTPSITCPSRDSLLHLAWPDDDVDMGSDMGPSQLDAALGAGTALLPPLAAGVAEGFAGPQQALAALVVRRFKVSEWAGE